MLTLEDKIALTADFPEAPTWVLKRDWSLKDARNAMIERRRLFPATAPMTPEKALERELFRILKHGATR